MKWLGKLIIEVLIAGVVVAILGYLAIKYVLPGLGY